MEALRGRNLTVSLKAVVFAVKGKISDEINLERLRLFLQQETSRKDICFAPDGLLLQGRVISIIPQI